VGEADQVETEVDAGGGAGRGPRVAALGEEGVGLDGRLKGAGVRQIVIAGIQVSMCNETTARMGGNLGYDVLFPLDAVHTCDCPVRSAGP